MEELLKLAMTKSENDYSALTIEERTDLVQSMCDEYFIPVTLTVPTINVTPPTPLMVRGYTMLSTKALVHSLSHKYEEVAIHLPSIDLYPFQKTQIEDTFSIGEVISDVKKNGNTFIPNALSLKVYECEKKLLYCNNILATKLLNGKGVSCEYISSPIIGVHYETRIPNSIHGLYRIREINIKKLLHSHDMSITGLRDLAKSLDNTDNFTNTYIAQEQLSKFQRLMYAICDNIEGAVRRENNILYFRNPITMMEEMVEDVSGTNLDDIINTTIKEVSATYSGINLDEALLEIDFIHAEDLNKGEVHFSDSFYIGKKLTNSVHVGNNIYFTYNLSHNLHIIDYSNNPNKLHHMNICGLVHTLDKINSPVNKIVVKMNNDGGKVFTIPEDKYLEYGIYDNRNDCMNSNMSKFTLDTINARIAEKELEQRFKLLKIDNGHKEYLARVDLIAKLIKLTTDNSSKALIIEKLKYEKSIAENGAKDLDLEMKRYAHGKNVLTDIVKLAI